MASLHTLKLEIDNYKQDNSHGKKTLPIELKRKILDQLSNHKISFVAKTLQIPDSTIHGWLRSPRLQAAGKITSKANEPATCIRPEDFIPIDTHTLYETLPTATVDNYEIELTGAEKKSVHVKFKKDDIELIGLFFRSIVASL